MPRILLVNQLLIFPLVLLLANRIVLFCNNMLCPLFLLIFNDIVRITIIQKFLLGLRFNTV